MDKKYYIALSLLGIKNDEIINIMNLVPNDEIRQLFTEKVIELDYKYNLGMIKYSQIFENKELIKDKINEAQNILNKNMKLCIKTIIYKERLYPEQLRKINNAPAIIYIKGKNILKNDLKSVACVGSRKPTEAGQEAAKSLVTNLVRERFTIISGLAMGIDGIAHNTCLLNQGKTIAVLAHGLDMIYPKEHVKLAEDIISNNGTLITEYPVGVKPEKFRFVDRNRIVTGLASGLLVIEAKEKSGTSRTVNFAINQNKPIFFTMYSRELIENSLNYNLFKSNKGIAINMKNDYILILKKLGYELKYDKRLINKLKNESIEQLVGKFTLDDNIDFNLLIKNVSKTGFEIDKDVYIKFKKILRENNITLKEFFGITIKNIVNNYK